MEKLFAKHRDRLLSTNMEWLCLPLLKEVDSTNNWLKERAAQLPSFSYVRALFQTAGRGQFERQWESQSGLNLLCSFLLKSLLPQHVPDIKSWIINSLMKLLSHYGIQGQFKEPNDIYVNQKKILGILIETKHTYNLIDWMVIGIGLNINQIVFQSPMATSMALTNGIYYSIESIEQELLAILKETNPRGS